MGAAAPLPRGEQWVCKRSMGFAGNRPREAKRTRLGESPSKRAEGETLSCLPAILGGMQAINHKIT